MGVTASVAVVHSLAVQSDREIVLAIFPGKFQVETAPDSGSVILVEEKLTLILVPCAQSKGTFATLVLDEDMIRQAAKRAVVYGVKVEEEHISDTTIVKLTMPGGACILAATTDVWKDPSARSAAVLHMLKPDATMSREFHRSMSMPDVRTAPPSPSAISISHKNRLFPSLRVETLAKEGRYRGFPLNTEQPVPVETDLFKGSILLTMRPANPEDDPYWNDRIFSKKKRRVVLQMQGKFKYKPEGIVFAGMEVSNPMNLGLLASGLCSFLLKLIQKFNPHIHYSFGDSKESAHIVFPASTFFEEIIETPPGKTPPKLGEPFVESAASLKARKAYKTKIDWDTSNTYSMSFHSMYIDFPSWSIVRLPGGRDMHLQTFWGDSLASVVLYVVGEHQGSKAKHLTSLTKKILAVQMRYLVKDSEEDFASSEGSYNSDDGWLEDQFIESESNSVSMNGEVALMPTLEEDSEEEVHFFDTVESQVQLPGALTALDISVTTPHTQLLRVIDEYCPCWIDVCAKKGKYTKVYAFQSRQQGTRPLLRTWDIASDYLGDRQLTDVEDRFSPRMSSAERTRRILGLRFAEALSGKSSPDRLLQFFKLKTHFDKRFLQREAPAQARLSTVKSAFIARALSGRHWIEELVTITARDILFSHPDKSKPNLRVSISSVVKVETMSDCDAPLLPTYHFMTVETFGRSIYLMFQSEDERNEWVDCILLRLIKRDETRREQRSPEQSFTTHLIDVDNPLGEFLHKSSMWDCNKRRIMNCRKFSFFAQNQTDPLALVEIALRRATALRPDGPNDSDLRGFLDCTAALKEADTHGLNEDQRKAFFLNLYHVMIMHAFLVLGPPDSSLKWISYFNSIAYQCSDDIFSLAELEHNIIRSEMSYPSQFFSRFVLPKSHYRFALSKPDYRINFALNCGSKSFPSGAIPIYKPDLVDEQLNKVASSFLKATISITTKSFRDLVISVPRICQWFFLDFAEDGSTSSFLEVIVPFLSEGKRKTLKQYWNDTEKRYDLSAWNIKYLPYSFECSQLTLETADESAEARLWSEEATAK